MWKHICRKNDICNVMCINTVPPEKKNDWALFKCYCIAIYQLCTLCTRIFIERSYLQMYSSMTPPWRTSYKRQSTEYTEKGVIFYNFLWTLQIIKSRLTAPAALSCPPNFGIWRSCFMNLEKFFFVTKVARTLHGESISTCVAFQSVYRHK